MFYFPFIFASNYFQLFREWIKLSPNDLQYKSECSQNILIGRGFHIFQRNRKQTGIDRLSLHHLVSHPGETVSKIQDDVLEVESDAYCFLQPIWESWCVYQSRVCKKKFVFFFDLTKMKSMEFFICVFIAFFCSYFYTINMLLFSDQFKEVVKRK